MCATGGKNRNEEVKEINTLTKVIKFFFLAVVL